MGDWVKPLFNRYDPYSIKGKLDEYITHELNNSRKFKQSFEYSNIKILLGFIAVIFTTIAHVYEYIFDAHFPKDYNITAICVVGYFLFNVLFQVFENYYEKETFYSGDPGIKGVKSIDLSSTIEKFDHMFKVKLFTYFESGICKDVEFSASVAEFFSKDGHLVKSNVQRLIEKIIKELKSKSQ